MKKLFLLRGIPGSGKTTLANFLLDFLLPDLEVHCYAADDYFTDDDGNYNFKIDRLSLAHNWCQVRTAKSMVDAKDKEELVIIVHNTFTTERELKPYLELANTHGFEVVSLVVENRHGHKSIHGVPDDTITKMKTRFSIHV